MSAAPRHIGVFDIGKTNAKFVVVDPASGVELGSWTMPNRVVGDGVYPHFDIDALWAFLCRRLGEANASHRLGVVSVTTHGAAAALVDGEGALSFPVLDYEHGGPDSLAADYDAVRPAFAESLTPPLPGGLNLARQIFWQARLDPEAFARTRWILPYPQYWSFRLTGLAASELTSIGCHTDLWNFGRRTWSSLVDREGWAEKMPPLHGHWPPLGKILPALAESLGLDRDVDVLVGIHDSNASLVPHLMAREPPFAVVSTGTWVVVGAPGGRIEGLDPSRDSYANIDFRQRPTPSARFMGGREFELLCGGDVVEVGADTVANVLSRNIMLRPAVVQGSGPFPAARQGWTTDPRSLSKAEQFAAVCFYLALMTAECLSLTGAGGDVIVEGPFCRNRLYLQMLGAAVGRPVLISAVSSSGTTTGAALLAQGHAAFTPPRPTPVAPHPSHAEMRSYAATWRRAAAGDTSRSQRA